MKVNCVLFKRIFSFIEWEFKTNGKKRERQLNSIIYAVIVNVDCANIDHLSLDWSFKKDARWREENRTSWCAEKEENRSSSYEMTMPPTPGSHLNKYQS